MWRQEFIWLTNDKHEESATADEEVKLSHLAVAGAQAVTVVNG